MPKVAIETHEFINFYRKAFGIVHTKKLFGVQSDQTVYKWGADPDFCAETRPNPIDRLEAMLSNLMEADEEEAARRLVDRMVMIVGCQMVCSNAVPDKKTFEEELLDTWPTVSDFQKAMIEKQPIPIVRDLHRKAKADLDEDLAIYLEKNMP